MHDSHPKPSDDSHLQHHQRRTDSDAVRLAQASVDRQPPTSHGVDESTCAEEIAQLTALLTMLGSERLIAQGAAIDETFRLGRFHVLGERGRGGFGIVLRAFDPNLQRDVALKLPRPERLLDGESPDEIIREARVAAQLDHPGIVPVFETGRWGPIWYIAAAYCPGPSLGEWLRERQSAPSDTEAAQLVAQAADAIHYAHCRGVLHLDLKPDNILLKGEALESIEFAPLITDFGLSGWSRSEPESPSVRIGGTPSYMAPEQVSGNRKEIGVATDVFALGAILADLLTGLEAEGLGERQRRCVELPKGVSPDLGAVVWKCLAPAPADRYASAKELADELRRFLNGETLQARPVGWPTACVRWACRRPALASSLLLLAAAIGAGLVTSGLLWRKAERNLVQFQQEARQREQAERQIEKSVLNLAWVAHKSKLSDSDRMAAGSPDLQALQLFMADMQNWRRQPRGLQSKHLGIEAAMHSLALLDGSAQADEPAFLRSYRQGLQCWQEVLKREPDHEHWRRALAAHLLTFHLHTERHEWLAWRSPEFEIEPSVAALVEMPYAELLVELSAFQLRNRRRSELSYSMLVAAIEILTSGECDEALSTQRQRLLLQAHNLAADAATYSSRRDWVQLHRAAADLIVANITEPQNCHPGMAVEVARTLAQQAHEAEAAGDGENALESFERAVKYLRYATETGAYNDRDYLELVRLYARIGRCLRALDRQDAANQSFMQSISVLNQALTRSPRPQRVMVVRRAVVFSRLAQSLLASESTDKAIEAFEAAARDFSEAGLRQADSKGAWLASIRTLQSLGKYYAAAGRYADSRRVYESSLRHLAMMDTFTRHPSVKAFKSLAEAAIRQLDESQGS